MTETRDFQLQTTQMLEASFVFIQINTFTYLRKISIYQTNSVNVELYLYSTK